MFDTSARGNDLLPNHLPAQEVVTNKSEMEKTKRMLKNLNQLYDDVKHFGALSQALAQLRWCEFNATFDRNQG